jgi:PAS domain S-box-containing protein
MNYLKTTLEHPTGLLWEKMVAEVEDYAFILLDPTGVILNWNKGAEKIKGYSKEEIIGKHFSIFYTPEDRVQTLPETLINEARLKGRALHEGWRIRKDGTKFWGNIVITALHNDEGGVIGFSKVTRDLSERKYAEDMMREKTRELERLNHELSSFAYVASHDLQEPLRKIQTFGSRIMEMEKDKFSEKGLEFFSRMHNAAMRMQTLIQDLLTYSRMTKTEGKFEEVDLNKVLEDVKSDLEETIHAKHASITAPSLPRIIGVPFQLRQLFLNLIGNALKFSKVDVPPQITITHQVVNGGTIEAHASDPKKKYHYITVQDNGIGFEPEYNEKIFEVFQRLHGKAEYSGTGIGLSICKKIMESHKGFIIANGEPDKGAVFHIYIPLL